MLTLQSCFHVPSELIIRSTPGVILIKLRFEYYTPPHIENPEAPYLFLDSAIPDKHINITSQGHMASEPLFHHYGRFPLRLWDNYTLPAKQSPCIHIPGLISYNPLVWIHAV